MNFFLPKFPVCGMGLAFLAMMVVTSVGCSNYGEKIVVNGTEIYFVGDNVTKETAEKLGQYLNDAEFSDGNEKSIQIAKPGDKWQFRMVTIESFWDDEDFAGSVAEMASELSQQVFDGEPVEFHICDDSFTTKKVVQAAEVVAPVVEEETPVLQ